MIKYRILKRNDNCVFLQSLKDFSYKIRDMENFDVFIGHDYDRALEVFNTHNLEELHAEQKKQLEKFLQEFATEN